MYPIAKIERPILQLSYGGCLLSVWTQDMGGVKQEQGEGTQAKGPNPSDPVHDEVTIWDTLFQKIVINLIKNNAQQ
jgi:hypothetical protein